MARIKSTYPTAATLKKRGEIWHYSFSFLGKQKRGSTHCDKKGKAQVMVDRIRKDISRGIDPTKYANVTIESIIDIAMQHYESINAASMATLRSRAKNLKRFLPLQMPVRVLDQRIMKKYYTDRQEAKPEVSSKSLNKEGDIIRIGLRLAHEDRLIPFKPSLRRLPEAGGRSEYLTEDEMFRVVEHLPDYLKNLIEFAFYSAMRKNELFHMQWSWLDTSDSLGWRLDIPAAITKTKTPRSLYLIDVLMPPIKAQLRKHPIYIFPTPEGGKIKAIDKHWHRALEKANLKNKHFHDLRTSAVRYWRIERDLSETNVMNITGHKSRKIFDSFYNIVEAKDVFEAIRNSKNKVVDSQAQNVIDINIKK